MMKSVSSQRALIQCLGRVGRYGQECQRMKCIGQEDLIDRDALDNLIQRINLACDPKRSSKAKRQVQIAA